MRVSRRFNHGYHVSTFWQVLSDQTVIAGKYPQCNGQKGDQGDRMELACQGNEMLITDLLSRSWLQIPRVDSLANRLDFVDPLQHVFFSC